MNFEPKLSKTENDIYEQILNQPSGNKAKNFTKAGGSLDKLRGVAEKVLKNPELNDKTKAQIYSNLQEAVEGKKLYYTDTKMGKITSFLKDKPGISKYFDDPINKTTIFIREGSNVQGKKVQGKDENQDRKAKKMIEHYSSQIDRKIEKIDEIVKKLTDISNDKDFDKNLWDDDFRFGLVADSLSRWNYRGSAGGKKFIQERAKEQINYIEEKKSKLEEKKQKLQNQPYSKKINESTLFTLNFILDGAFTSAGEKHFTKFNP